MSTEDRLRKIITEFDESIDVASLSRESSLKKDLALSSVSLLYLAVAIEDEFGVDFASRNFGEIRTIGDIIDIIEAEQ